MKSNVVLATFKAFANRDFTTATQLLRQLAAHELQLGRAKLSGQLMALVDSQPRTLQPLGMNTKAPAGLFVTHPTRWVSDLVLEESVAAAVSQLVAEWKAAAYLRENGLAPRQTLLLHGPSGNGKTSLAEAIAMELQLPFAVMQFSAIVKSHMGDSARALDAALQWLHFNPSVLLVDECDSICCSRSEASSGAGQENNRLVNQFMLSLDSLQKQQGESIVILATNMAPQLDPALKRRIALQLEIPPPTDAQRELVLEAAASRWPMLKAAGCDWVGDPFKAESFAAVEAIVHDTARAELLKRAKTEAKTTTEND